MNELFDPATVDSKSPRMNWLEKHDIHLQHRNDLGPDWPKWEAYVGDYDEAIGRTVNGDMDEPIDGSKWLCVGFTEEEAIVALAKNRGIRLWHEEDFASKK